MAMPSFKSFFRAKDKPSASIEPTTASKSLTKDFDELRHVYPIDSFLSKLEDVVGLPEQHFDALYLIPIQRLACRLQHIPTTERSSHSLIEEKLRQILLGMQFRESFIMPVGVAPEDINHKRDIWRYATFFALVLSGLGPAMTAYQLTIKTTNGNFKQWKLFEGPPDIGTELGYSPKEPVDPLSSLMLAPLIFSPAALDWLGQDALAFSEAVSAIHSPSRQSLIGQVVCRAQDIEVTKTEVIEASSRKIVAPLESAVTVSLTSRQHGEQFYQWLLAGVQENEKRVTSLSMQIDDAVAFKAPAIFMAYAKTTDTGWKTVKNGFNKLGLHNVHKNADKAADWHALPDHKGDKCQWLLIDAHQFSGISSDTQRESSISFMDWLSEAESLGTLVNTKDKPYYLTVGGYIYLVIPAIFDAYAEAVQSDSAAVQSEFLSLEKHLKNGDSDYFEFSSGAGDLKTIKIALDILQHVPRTTSQD